MSFPEQDKSPLEQMAEILQQQMGIDVPEEALPTLARDPVVIQALNTYVRAQQPKQRYAASNQPDATEIITKLKEYLKGQYQIGEPDISMDYY